MSQNHHSHHVMKVQYTERKPMRPELITANIKNSPQKLVSYSGGKDYWGTQHAVQIRQFYSSVLGLEELEITAREALKIQKIICDIYNNDSNKMKK